ncbi:MULTISPECIES: sigma-54-dependent transcriptional regulator [Niastella]|uniref:Sigma-54-dependent Fis family transcriptional regulator n=1 Tax=Niastella soli TaxID=2821487 RepID=A0ABS3Z3W0_9BACT|nr:sigma-54 dependent transcriptional regulator [Niastella soli]MBO9204830.1 sigma-54-dependent Fis family transcriptional regulator [Niastella soli]
MERILIVEDELIVARDIRKILEKAGYKTTGVARSVEDAMTIIAESRPTFVLVDIFLKGKFTGIDLALQLNKANIPFIYISANSNQGVLEAAKTTNPYGFIVKPFRERDLLVTLDIARYRYEMQRQLQSQELSNSATKPFTGNRSTKIHRHAYKDLIGASASMIQVYQLIEQVAPFDTSVLLLGESGTGKEVVANSIVQASERKTKPFIRINCAAIPASLIEAELFGYEKGAFTGANKSKPGKLALADGGTILLDEIGEMPMDMQAKLLRVLQEKEIEPIGATAFIKTNIRIIAATNRNLEQEVGQGRFRLDLYYRLHVFPITLPPLRERKEDIPLLVKHFIQYYSNKLQKTITGVDEPAMQKLQQYNWLGNVRELQHRIERSVLLAKDNVIHDI